MASLNNSVSMLTMTCSKPKYVTFPASTLWWLTKTENTLSDSKEVRAELLRKLYSVCLNRFKQRSASLGRQAIDFDSGV